MKDIKNYGELYPATNAGQALVKTIKNIQMK